MALLITLIWGLIGEQYKLHIAVGFMALSVEDDAAAIIGKRFGKRKLKLGIFDKNKTFEGSLTMAGFAFLPIFALLFFFTSLPLIFFLLSALVLVVLSSFVEAVALHGLDTYTLSVLLLFLGLVCPYPSPIKISGGDGPAA